MEPSPEPRETISRFEKLLAALVTIRVDFAVVDGLAVIFKARGDRQRPHPLPVARRSHPSQAGFVAGERQTGRAGPARNPRS